MWVQIVLFMEQPHPVTVSYHGWRLERMETGRHKSIYLKYISHCHSTQITNHYNFFS